ncbi:hypothetical protein BS47DRAFT_1353782 [Hydnum rufescens UP504]|uniref:Uncharacterized protein n=1 Tax=Hydnum rufescens UP504 TaxID=1448309 RepID=A0A9P6AHU8_9AGAM|nr:hypothetical protein BS47DRAFT_1353782 [Hydnum rufescens UP504]
MCVTLDGLSLGWNSVYVLDASHSEYDVRACPAYLYLESLPRSKATTMFATRSPLSSPAALKHVISHGFPFPSSPASPRPLQSPKVQSPIMHHPIPGRSAKFVEDSYFPLAPPPRLPNPAPRLVKKNITYFTEPSTARPRLNTRVSSIIGEALGANITPVESETRVRTEPIGTPMHSPRFIRQRGGTIWEGHRCSLHVNFRKPSTSPESILEGVIVENTSAEARVPKNKRRCNVRFSDPVIQMASTVAEIHQSLSHLSTHEDKYTLNAKKNGRRQTPGVLEADRESYGF